MAGESPVKSMKSGVVSTLVLVDGKEIPKTMYVQKIEVCKEINKIPFANIHLFDGDSREQTFPLSEDALFEPGKEVEIKVGQNPGEEKPIYKGLIVKHGIKLSQYSGTSLVLTCKDEALKLTLGRKNQIFYDQKDSDIISKVVKDAGLKADVEATNNQHKKLIQYYSTDWDFIQARADANSLVTIINDGDIAIKKPTVSEQTSVLVTYGKDLLEMNLKIDSTYQYDEVQANCWDHTKQEILNDKGETPTANKQGDLDSAKLKKVLTPKDLLHTTAPVTKEVMKDWASSLYQRGVLSRIRGYISSYGTGKLEVGKVVELADIGSRFNGEAYISKLEHKVQNGQWTTKVHFGLPTKPYMEETINAGSLPAGGFLPAIHGLQHGVVKQIDSDPDGEFRVLVTIPIIDGNKGEGVWARMGHYYATEECGFVFYPEIGDEVILGFFNNDPTYPVILGSLYSSKAHPITTEEKHEPADPNKYKAISLQKGKMRLEFDDEDCIIKVITPHNHLIEINDKEDYIMIEDPVNKNKMVMDNKGILLETDLDIVMKAKQNIKMEAGMNIETKSDMDTKMEAGVNFEIKGGASLKEEAPTFEIKGSAMGTVDGGGMLTVKGGLVQIN